MTRFTCATSTGLSFAQTAAPGFASLIAIVFLYIVSPVRGDDAACKTIVDALEGEIGKFTLLKRTHHGNGAGSSATFAYTAGPRADVTLFLYDRNREVLNDEFLEAEFNQAHQKVVADFTGKDRFTVMSAGQPATPQDTFAFEGIYAMTLPNGIKLRNAMLLSRHGGKYLKIVVTTEPQTFPALRPHLKELEKHLVSRLMSAPWR